LDYEDDDEEGSIEMDVNTIINNMRINELELFNRINFETKEKEEKINEIINLKKRNEISKDEYIKLSDEIYLLKNNLLNIENEKETLKEELGKSRSIIMKHLDEIKLIESMKDECLNILAENKRLKNELSNEAQVIIKFIVKKINDVQTYINHQSSEDEVVIGKELQGEYAFIANIKGFENFDQSLLDLVKLNKSLHVENQMFKSKCDNLIEQMKEMKEKNKKTLKENFKKMSDQIYKNMETKRDFISLYNYVMIKKKKKK